ncbi:MAG TPA: aminopeptidase [Gammaproteobacteria bacterium]|nr:aminopeptidase [Gammaproteobacteria bacterium]
MVTQRAITFMHSDLVKSLNTALLTLGLSGCANLGYYAQSLHGQWEVSVHSRPIAQILQDACTDEATKEKLRQVLVLRKFAVTALALPDNDSYRAYADLDRPYVVWNVFATPELSLQPVRSCFLVVGCLSYRGYFQEADARAYADELRRAGDDVHVGGVVAYSTLGWFDDPVLNTMLKWDDAHMAKFLFHELAHQKLYVRDDSAFNEAFATAVAEEGWRRWQDAHHMAANGNAELAYETGVIHLVLATKGELETLYDSALTVEEKRRAKKEIFNALRADYDVLRQRWEGRYDAYDHWMHGDLNNAKIMAVATYHDLIPAFTTLLAVARGDLPRFYALAATVGRLPPKERSACLEALRQSGTGISHCKMAN